MLAKNSTTQNTLFGLQPQLAWMAILGFVILASFCLLIRFSNVLQILFPAGALAVGAFLYFRYPVLYLGFNWWVWFLSPFVSRLVEYQNGIVDPGMRLIILSPYLVTMLTAITFFKHLPRLTQKGGLAFILAFVSVLYALAIGFAQGNPITRIIQAVLSWLPGIFLGTHLMVNWQDYPQFRKNTQRVFLWGILVMGTYGVYQYLVAPEWDRFWLRNAEDLQLCCGWPEPMMMRVWSTLNYPFTFAYAMMACLLIVFGSRSPLAVPSILVGFLAFLLTQVRGAWVGWLIGLMSFFTALRSNLQVRLIGMFLTILVLLVPLVTMTSISSGVVDRLLTLSNVQSDYSANERQAIYGQLLSKALSEFLGRGMGGQAIIDAGILDVIATLGWVGFLFYACAVGLVLSKVSRYAEIRLDPFMSAARSILPSILVTLPFNNALVLLPGILFWSFSGMTIAAHTYHEHQKSSSKS